MAAREAILEAVRARLAAAMPGAPDVSDDPEPAPAAALPTYAVALRTATAERFAMGGAAALVTLDLDVSVWAQGTPPRLESTCRALGDVAAAALVGAPANLGGLVVSILATGADFTVERGEKRVGRITAAHAVQFIEGGE